MSIEKTEMDKVIVSSSQKCLQVSPHDVVVYQSTRADFQSSKKVLTSYTATPNILRAVVTLVVSYNCHG